MIPIVLGVASTVLILFVFASILQRENRWHEIFRILIILFAVTLTMLIPKATIDAKTVCEVVLVNETDTEAAPTVEKVFEYEEFCYDRDENTAETFYDAYLWFLRIFWAGVFIYLIYEVFISFLALARRKGR